MKGCCDDLCGQISEVVDRLDAAELDADAECLRNREGDGFCKLYEFGVRGRRGGLPGRGLRRMGFLHSIAAPGTSGDVPAGRRLGGALGPRRAVAGMLCPAFLSVGIVFPTIRGQLGFLVPQIASLGRRHVLRVDLRRVQGVLCAALQICCERCGACGR